MLFRSAITGSDVDVAKVADVLGSVVVTTVGTAVSCADAVVGLDVDLAGIAVVVAVGPGVVVTAADVTGVEGVDVDVATKIVGVFGTGVTMTGADATVVEPAVVCAGGAVCEDVVTGVEVDVAGCTVVALLPGAGVAVTGFFRAVGSMMLLISSCVTTVAQSET